MDHIRALAEEDIAKGGVAVVAGAAEHDVFAVDLAREEHAVAVEGQQRIFQEVELLEIVGVADADGRAVVAVAPGDVIAVFEPDHARVVAVLEAAQFRGRRRSTRSGWSSSCQWMPSGLKPRWRFISRFLLSQRKTPANAPLERHDRAVENAVGGRDQVARDDGVGAVAPDHITAAGGAFFPGNIGKLMRRGRFHLQAFVHGFDCCIGIMIGGAKINTEILALSLTLSRAILW